MAPIRIVIAGPGRAGGSIGIAALRAGHQVVGVVPGPSGAVPVPLADLVVSAGALPPADLLLVATRDGQIEAAARDLAPRCEQIAAAAHLSGFTPLRVLEPLSGVVPLLGSLHPLQTLPDAETGSTALAGAWAAVTGEASPVLTRLATDLGMTPFSLSDQAKPSYHAAASAAANFIVECLAVAADLLADADVPLQATRPLVDQVVENVYRLGPEGSLTGPVARGDRWTVLGQIAAAERVAPELGEQYRLLVEALAGRVGRQGEFR